MTNIAVLVGSLRADSINKKLAKAIEELAPEEMEFSHLDISEVPLFNQDNEGEIPESVKKLKNEIEAADGILFVTPEYNRGLPGVMKNAIDWASRPYGENSFAGKPAGVVGATGSPWGTVGSQIQLKGILLYLDMHVLGQPEVYFGGHNPLYDESGTMQEEGISRINRFNQAFKAHVDVFVK